MKYYTTAFFLILISYELSFCKCQDNETWINRKFDESYSEMKAWHTNEWLANNKTKITTKEDLLKNFIWQSENDNNINSKVSSYKFSIGKNCDFMVSKMNYVEAEKLRPKDMNHVLLAQGDRVVTAGVINLTIKKNIQHITLTNSSHRFCPSLDSLNYAKDRLIKMGWLDKEISLSANLPSNCLSK